MKHQFKIKEEIHINNRIISQDHIITTTKMIMIVTKVKVVREVATTIETITVTITKVTKEAVTKADTTSSTTETTKITTNHLITEYV